MSNIQLTSHSMLQPPAFASAAQKSIGQGIQPVSGQSSRNPAIQLGVQTSLTGNVDALKAQQKALDHLDSVLGAAKKVLQQVAPLVQGGDAGADQAAAVDSTLRGAKYGDAPLFDPAINSKSVGTLLQSENHDLSIFSPQVRDSLQSSFDSAFDIYA